MNFQQVAPTILRVLSGIYGEELLPASSLAAINGRVSKSLKVDPQKTYVGVSVALSYLCELNLAKKMGHGVYAGVPLPTGIPPDLSDQLKAVHNAKRKTAVDLSRQALVSDLQSKLTAENKDEIEVEINGIRVRGTIRAIRTLLSLKENNNEKK